VEEAADQGGIDVSAAVDLVPLDKLPRFVGRKVGALRAVNTALGATILVHVFRV
jgi:hypothetical protein